jgi:hypothetical protein
LEAILTVGGIHDPKNAGVSIPLRTEKIVYHPSSHATFDGFPTLVPYLLSLDAGASITGISQDKHSLRDHVYLDEFFYFLDWRDPDFPENILTTAILPRE